MTADRSTASFVVSLDGAGHESALIGGKGAALDRLIGLGFVVPETIAITTEAYDRFVQHPELDAFLRRIHDEKVPEGDEVDRSRAEVDAQFLAAPMPPEILDCLARAIDQVPWDGPWAVRSSATAEDLSDASFAGQYSSFLDISAAGLERAIRLVWASLWHPAPRQYRKFRSVEDDRLSMAVVVMRMLRPSHAGVMFTSDPMGRTNNLRIELVEGLAEALVSGDVTPEVLMIDKADPGTSVAGREFLSDLVAVGHRAERTLGCPQDIEWAVDGGHLFVVQARPITTSAEVRTTDDGFDSAHTDNTLFTTGGIAEMLPGHVGPRLWTLNRRLLDEGLRLLFRRLDATSPLLDDPDSPLLARFHGRVALNLDAMKSAAASIPGGSSEELEHQYFGDMSSAAPAPSVQTSFASMRQGARMLRVRSAMALESEIVLQVVDAIVAADIDLDGLSDGQLLTLRARLVHFGARAMAAEIGIAAMATASYRSVENFLAHHLDADDNVTTATQAMTSGSGASRRGSLALDLAPLAARLTDCADLQPAVLERDWQRAKPLLESSEAGRQLVADFESRLRRAGSTAVFGGSTWNDAPELAWLTMIRPTEDDEQADARRFEARRQVEKRLTSHPAWKYSRVVSGQVLDARKHFLRREAAEAAAFLDRRELSKAAVLRVGGVVHRVDEEIGRRLVLADRLESAEDIDLLDNFEPADLFTGSGPSLEQLATRRRRGSAASQSGSIPRVFRGSPGPATIVPVAGDNLPGWAASPGRYEGPARLITEPGGQALRRGDVLVASTTDASWAPLFMIAGAIVVEEGGPLSHAAIVARELGVPAVVNVPGIVQRVAADPDGLNIVVDGTTGQLVLRRRTGTEPPRGVPPAVGIAPIRPAPEITETGMGLNVFITGLIGAGAVMSMVFALTEAVSGKRAQRRFERKAKPVATAASFAVLEGFIAAASSPVGLRPRRHYGWASAWLTLFALFVLAESSESYSEAPPGQISTLLWGLTLVTGLQIAGIAGLVGVSAKQWPRVVPELRRFAPARGSVPSPVRHRTDWAAATTGLLVIVFVVLTLINLWAPSMIGPIDERLYDAMGSTPENARIGPDWFRWFGQPRVVMPLAVAIGAASFRCRVLAWIYPAVIVGAGLINLIMWWLVARRRPLFGIHAGRLDSFPGGHAITVTLLFGILPLAVYVVTNRRWAMHLTRVAATAAGVILMIDQVRQGGHWPSDQAAGLILGLAGVVAVHGLVGSRTAHFRCVKCPWATDSYDGLRP